MFVGDDSDAIRIDCFEEFVPFFLVFGGGVEGYETATDVFCFDDLVFGVSSIVLFREEGECFLDFCFFFRGDVVLFCEFGAAFCGRFGGWSGGLFSFGSLWNNIS